jgi:DNA-binding CsgD family transcriptional regulator
MKKRLNILKKKLEKRETELKTVSHTLVLHKQELVKTKSELGRLNRELVQTNQAMCVLAKNIEAQKDALENKVNTTITNKIMPIIRELQTEPRIKKFWPQINSIAEYLNSITTKNKSYHKAIGLLTETEMKIAAMIKNGMSSKEITSLMHITLETVKTHRKHIRRKLNIHNTKHKLSSYLLSVLGND